jgi:ATP-binding cassette subfamily B protein
LDTRTEQEILATLRRIAKGRTTIAIAHRLSTIADADNILVLDHGRLVESGDHTALIARGGLYAEMWNRQANERREDDLAAEAAE